jgi:CRP-like cAMP-binding protein
MRGMVRQTYDNEILRALPEPIYETWQAHFEEVFLRENQVLIEPGQNASHVYFPLDAIVSWQYVLENGDSTEIAMVGREGMVGVYLLLGNNSTPNQGVVQTAGQAIRMRLKGCSTASTKALKCSVCCSDLRKTCQTRWAKAMSAVSTTASTSNCVACC